MSDLDDFPFDELLDDDKISHRKLITKVIDYVMENRKGKPDWKEVKTVEQILRAYKELGYIKGRWIRTGIWSNDPFIYFLDIGGDSKENIERISVKIDQWRVVKFECGFNI